MRTTRRALSALVLASATACGSDGGVDPRPVDAPNSMRLTSDAGDAMGNGATFSYTGASALVTVRPYRAALSMRVVADSVWDGALVLAGERVRTGTFADLPAQPSAASAGSAFRWSSQDRSCATSRSTVTIDTATYDGDALVALHLGFEQHCGGSAAALRGTVHWRASAEISASGPILPIPAALWRAPASATPPTGRYAYLEMDSSLSGGTSYPRLIALAPNVATVTASGRDLALSSMDAPDDPSIRATFRTMSGVTTYTEGYYHDLRGAAESGPLAAALDVALRSRACQSFSAWFAIDHVFYFSGRMTALDLRFEQRCSGVGTPVRGQIHWVE